MELTKKKTKKAKYITSLICVTLIYFQIQGVTMDNAEQYMPMAKKLAYQMKRNLPRFIDVEDLISAAYLGLVEAAARYDETKGKFSTYAFPRIKGAICDYLRQQRWYKQEVCETATKEVSYSEMLEVASCGLDDQAHDILRYYFIEQYSMKEVGSKIGVTEGRVSQIIKGYMSRLRQRYERNELQELLAA
jgi:RNA polymerase sigma factor (sigma-70 family)